MSDHLSSPQPAKYDNEQMPCTEVGPQDRILWLDDLPDRLEAQDQPEEESKIGDGQERSDRGKQKDPPYEIGRKLGEQFASTARLYAEAVSVFTSRSLTVSRDECNRLRKVAEEAQRLAEGMGIAFEEHLESQRRQAEGLLLRSEMTKAQGA